MQGEWQAHQREIRALIALVTACLGLLALLLATVYGVIQETITSDVLGTIEGMSVGGGLLGFALILYRIIKLTL